MWRPRAADEPHLGPVTSDWLTPMSRSDAESSRGEYSILLARVRGAGLLDRRSSHYWPGLLLLTSMLSLGWLMLVVIGDSWLLVPLALYIAVVSTQSALYAHDAGHSQMSASKNFNYVVGLITANLAVGVGLGWWVSKHRQHHVYPNHEGQDPDLVNKFIALTPTQAVKRSGLHRIIRRREDVWFFPLITFMAIAMHIHSVSALFRPRYHRRMLEATILGIHFVLYITVIVMVLQRWYAILFIVVEQGAFGFYLGCLFAPNHKGMRIWETGDRVDFLHRQVLSSRNIRGNVLIDIAFGGLNYQIEHHLFPSMPRRNLRRARPIVREFCIAYGIPYVETQFMESIKRVSYHLRALSNHSEVCPVEERALNDGGTQLSTPCGESQRRRGPCS
jgi:fatty acid desaturase